MKPRFHSLPGESLGHKLVVRDFSVPNINRVRVDLIKRHKPSYYNTVRLVKYLDNGFTFMSVSCMGVILFFLFFYVDLASFGFSSLT